MADILERLGSNVKSTLSNIKGLPFSSLGGTYGSSGYMGGSLPGWGFSFQGTLPGSQFDDSAAAGVLWENPAAAACFVALTKAFAQAKPCLEQKKKGNDWERVDHEIIELIERPNDFYSGEKMFGVTLICAMSQGAAFWRLERDKRNMPVNIWYEPPVGVGMTGIAPNWDSQNFIKDYYRFVDGQRESQPLDPKDVVYFRHGLNVANPRMPWSPLGLGAREIATLNAASTYTSAVLRNFGAPAGFIGMGDVGENGTGATPEQARELKKHIEANFGGPQNAGKTFVSPLPWRWNKVGMTPTELVIDQIRQWPQETICALLGTPVIVALLPTGTQPTYENLESSMKWWWDNTITPLEDSFADELETQLFPSFGLDTNEFRIAWDRSKVPALQDDEVAKHTMWRSDYQAGLIDRATFLERIGEVAKPEDVGVYFGAPQNEQDQNAQNLIKTGGQPAAKSEWVESEHPRDKDGKFGSGGSKGSFTVSRMNQTTKQFEDHTFKVGEQVKLFISKDNSSYGEITNINHDKQQVRVKHEGSRGSYLQTWDFGDVSKDDSPPAPEPHKPKQISVGSALDRANARGDSDGLTEDDAVPLDMQSYNYTPANAKRPKKSGRKSDDELGDNMPEEFHSHDDATKAAPPEAKSFTLKLTEDDMPNDDQVEAKNEDEIIEANTDGEFTVKDIEDALQSRTPAMQALLTARPDKKENE